MPPDGRDHAKRNAHLRARQMAQELRLRQLFALDRAIDGEAQMSQGQAIELEEAGVPVNILHRPQCLALIFPHHFHAGVRLVERIGKVSPRIGKAGILDQLVDRIDDFRVNTLRFHGVLHALDAKPTRLELGGEMQVTLLHFLGEREIGPCIALGGIAKDRAEALRRQAGGDALLMGASNACNGWRRDLFREKVDLDRPAIRTKDA